MSKKDKFKEEHITVLELYIELEATKFSKKKKDIYIEIQKKTKKNLNTIISWIKRYLESYKEYRTEIIEEENNAIKGNYGSLTKKFEKYIFNRYSGMGQEEAKIKAGYSPKTKVANIERNPKVSASIAILRERFIDDARYGAMANLNVLTTIRDRGVSGIEQVEYIDESGPDGHLIRKSVKKIYPDIAAVAATKEINSMLGFRYLDELKAEKQKKENSKQLVLIE